MAYKGQKSHEKWHERILEYLLEDPTRSIREIAKEMKTYRQKAWRQKKKLEEDKVIWGYTAIVDESKFNHVMYIILMKMGPMTRNFADIITKRLTHRKPMKDKVRLLNVLYMNGEYDLLIMFTAPDHATARRYYDSLRIVYNDYLLEKPAIMDVNFQFIREGKINPEIEKIYGFIPQDL